MRIVRFNAGQGETAKWGEIEGSNVFVTDRPLGSRSGESVPLAGISLLAEYVGGRGRAVGNRAMEHGLDCINSLRFYKPICCTFRALR